MTEPPAQTLEDLGDHFEIIEDPAGAPGPAAPAPEPRPAPAAAGRAAPLRSTDAWVSMGLAVGLAGLLGEWKADGTGSFNLIHGFLFAGILWALLCKGFAAVHRTDSKVHPALPGVLALYAAGRVLLELTQNNGLADHLSWKAEGDVVGVSGAVFAFLGGVIALLGPKLGARRDAKLPPPPPPREVDQQFAGSLLAYLLCAVGLTMHWTPASTGAACLFGVLTLICVLLALWASWVGMWRLWTMPLVTGRMGLILFLAPIEALVMSLGGLALQMAQTPAFLTDAWPGIASPFLVFGGGPIITLFGAGLALYLLLAGTKQAMALSKQKKEEEIAARKAAREARKGGKDKS